MSLGEHVSRNESPPPPFDGHNSSADESSVGRSSSNGKEQSAEDTEDAKGVNSEDTISDAIPTRPWSRNQRCITMQSGAVPFDSECTE
jgi:hypothetical protein